MNKVSGLGFYELPTGYSIEIW